MVCIYVGLVGFLTFFSRHTNISQAEPSLADGEFFIESFYMHSLSRFSLPAKIFPPLCRRFVNIHTMPGWTGHAWHAVICFGVGSNLQMNNFGFKLVDKPKMEWFKLCSTSKNRLEKNRNHLFCCPRWNNPNLCVYILWPNCPRHTWIMNLV